MADSANHLASAQQHVLEAEEHVARQRDLLAELERDNHPRAAKLARAILENLEKSLELAREHLKRVQDRESWEPPAQSPDLPLTSVGGSDAN